MKRADNVDNAGRYYTGILGVWAKQGAGVLGRYGESTCSHGWETSAWLRSVSGWTCLLYR
jgi:hypothetical protein